MSQVINPNSSIRRVGKERSLVCLVLIAFIDCGKYAKVVNPAARSPNTKVNVSNYCICSLMFRPASFEVLVVMSRLSPVGSIFVYL